MALEQEGFRWRNDDGSETAATWKATQDTNISLALDNVVRLRVLLNVSSNPAPATSKYRLEYKEAAESIWTEVKVGGSGRVVMAASSNITSGGQATTFQLTAPSGKTTSDFSTGRMWDDESGLDDVALADSKYTELEFSIQAVSANGAANGHVYSFRLVYLPAAGADIAIGVHGKNATHESSLGPVLNTQPTGSTFFIFVITRGGGITNAGLITDTYNNTWVAAGTEQSGAGELGGNQIYGFYVSNGAGGNSHQVDVSAADGAGGSDVFFVEILNAAAASYDSAVLGETQDDTPAAWTVPSGTPSQANELILTMILNGGAINPTTNSCAPGFTILDQFTDGVGSWVEAIAYKIISDGAAVTPSWTADSGTSGLMKVVGFKD